MRSSKSLFPTFAAFILIFAAEARAQTAPGAPGATGPAGPAGPAGKDGINGTNGTDGKDGKDGVSVTAATEPAGTNCANGGSKFTAANGTAYACNGSDGSSSGSDACSRGVTGGSDTAGGTVDVGGCTSLGLTGNSTAVCALDGGVAGQVVTVYADPAWLAIGADYFFVNELTYPGQFTCNSAHNLRLNGSEPAGVLVGSPNRFTRWASTLQLMFDGQNWAEVSESANAP